jgi:MerR family transcriptional regulator/heat shock protein HspR
MEHTPGLERSPVDDTTGLFAISVAAERSDLPIQNLRLYERRGLLEPARTAGGTRLYSEADIAVLQRIGTLLGEGLNLAGIRRVLQLEGEISVLRAKLQKNRSTPQGPVRKR